MGSWIERQRNILDFTISSLLRRKAKNLAFVIVYTLIVFLLASVMFFTQALKREASIILKDAPEIVVQRITAGRHDLIPDSYIEKIQKIKGVISVKGRLWGYYYDPRTRANFTLIVPEDFKYDSGEIIIGKGISRSRLSFEGDIIPFRTYNGKMLKLKVREILTSESELVSSDIILTSKHDFRRLFGISERYFTDLSVRIKNQREIQTIARKITKILPDTRPIVRDEILRTYNSVFDWRGGILIVILSGAIMAFTIFAWEKASGLSAEEKEKSGY